MRVQPELFRGFPKETFAFFHGLAAHNEKAWFEAHRDDYLGYVLEPAMDLVVDLGAKLRAIARDVHAEPKVGGSVGRIYRDIRFSRDKRPYKTSQELWLWQGPSRSGSPGYWFSLAPERLVLGVGMHLFDRPTLERYRRSVADARKGGALAKVTAKLRREGYEIGGQAYKRVPQGYEADGERAELLKHDGLYVGVTLKPPPKQVHAATFPAFCVTHYKRMTPVQEWLVEHLS